MIQLLQARRVAVLSLLLWLCAVLVPRAHAQERSLYWERFDVDIEVQGDGSLQVTERNQINFTGGTFRFGFREIPTNRLTAIDNIEVTVDGEPLTRTERETAGGFLVTDRAGGREIRYFFPTPTSGQHSIVLRYTVEGAIRYYEGGDQLWWEAVYAERPATVAESRVTVTLPGTVDREQLEAAAYYTAADVTVSDDGQQLAFRASEPIPPGQPFEVRAQFPKGVVSGSAPPWQATFDRQQVAAEQRAQEQARLEAQREQERAARAARGQVIGVLVGGLSLILLAGGLLGVFMLWYNRGRDRTVALTADYLSEPPSDLAAGLVGTLIDEQADLKDVMATLLDLARKGAIRIEESAKSAPTLFGAGSSEFAYELVDADRARTRAETVLVREFFGDTTRRTLDDLRASFYRSLPAIQQALYEDVVQAGHFSESPAAVRGRYQSLGVLLLVLAVASFVGAIVGSASFYTDAFFCLPFTFGAIGIALLLFAQAMPRKTPEGSEAASRWQAFRRYLQGIDRYGDLEEKKAIWDEYLPYAVAFGLERSYIQKFAQVNAPIPRWYAPYGYGFPHPYGPAYGYGSNRGGLGTGAGIPTGTEGTLRDSFPGGAGGGLQGASDSMALGLQGMSDSFASMLSTTATTLTSTPAPSASDSSGWSGGSTGGWSGGSSGGFGGGGSFGGGSSGGGSGGFG